MLDVKPNFVLLKKDSDRPTHIRMLLYSVHLFPRHRRLVWGTGRRIDPMLWDADAQRPFTSGNQVDKYVRRHKLNKSRADIMKTRLTNLKRELERIELETLDFIATVENERPRLPPAQYRKHLDAKFKGVMDASTTLTDYIGKAIAAMRSGEKRLPKNNKRYTEGTIKNYDGFLSVWKEFETKTAKGRPFTFAEIDLETYHAFNVFCETKPLTDAHGNPRKDEEGAPIIGLAVNTIGRHVSKWKAIMDMAKDDGVHSNDIHRHRAFVAVTEDTDGTYLKQSELNRLNKLDLSANPTWERVRDVFVVGCYTAQRQSDYTRLSSAMFVELGNGHKALSFIQHKGNNRVVIPAHPVVVDILAKYGGDLPKVGDNVINNHIKAICRAAGINERYVASRGDKGRRGERSGPKWEFVASHTARRTGITLMHLSGMDIHKIAEVSGHRDIKQLQKYIKASKAESAEIISGSSFFARNTSPLKAVNNG